MALPKLDNKVVSNRNSLTDAEIIEMEKSAPRLPSSIKFKLDAKAVAGNTITIASLKTMLADIENLDDDILEKVVILDSNSAVQGDAAAKSAVGEIRQVVEDAHKKDLAGLETTGFAQIKELGDKIIEAFNIADPDSPLFIIGDSLGFVEEAWQGLLNDPEPQKISNETFKKYLQSGGIRFSGMRITSENGDAKAFANDIFYAEGDLDGYYKVVPKSLEKSVDGETYDNSIQEFSMDLTLAKRQALIMPVPANDVLWVTLYTQTDYNRR
jgi:hypothetical protein